jgi:hypothetical protein
MALSTVEGILHPDGRLDVSRDQLPSEPVRVLVTILGAPPEAERTELGDYLAQLTDYEERLARGEIQWP